MKHQEGYDQHMTTTSSLVDNAYLQSFSDALQVGNITGCAMTKVGDVMKKHEVHFLILILIATFLLDYSSGKCCIKNYHKQTTY